MAFSNPVVGGVKLIREAIQSPNYVTGVSGWTINRDGSAEFNNVTIRGSLVVTGNVQSSNFVAGASGWRLESNGNAQFYGTTTLGGNVTVAGDLESSNFSVGIAGWRLRSNGEAEFNGNVTINNGTITGGIVQTASSGQHVALQTISGDSGLFIYDGSNVVRGSLAYDTVNGGGAYFRTEDGTGSSTLFLNETGSTLLLGASDGNESVSLWYDVGSNRARFEVFGISVNDYFSVHGEIDGSYVGFAHGNLADEMAMISLADGKAPGSTVETVLNQGSDTLILGANAQDVLQIGGHAYRALLSIDHFSPTAIAADATRIDYKLWDGAVGGTQLGGTLRIPISIVGPNRETVLLQFLWEAPLDTTIANLNVSGRRAVNGGTASAEVNSAFSIVIEDLGPASRIQNL